MFFEGVHSFVALDHGGSRPVDLKSHRSFNGDAFARDGGNLDPVEGPAVSVEEDSQTVHHESAGLLLRQVGLGGAHQRQRQVSAVAGGDLVVREGSADLVDAAQVRLAVLHASNQERVPQRVELGASVVEHAGQPRVQRLGLQCEAVVGALLVDPNRKKIKVEYNRGKTRDNVQRKKIPVWSVSNQK